MISSQQPNHCLPTMNFSSALHPELSDRESTPDSLEEEAGKKKVPNELTSHGTTPLGKPRLFVCNTCTRAFARLEHLRRHERSHTKEKPFTCGVCQRKFSRRDLLLRHAQKLHAGCADAITRLRRKLVKSNSVSSDCQDLFDDSTLRLSPQRRDSSNLTPGTSVMGKASGSIPTPSNSHRGSMDGVHFNLNLFNSPQNISKVKKDRGLSRSSSVKDSNLQKQLFDRRNATRNRGASFSAQSGANYSYAVDDFNNTYPVADTVEFSTPQLLPSSTQDEYSWLNNLSTIPSMDGFSKGQAMKMTRDDSISSLNLESQDNQTPFSMLLRSDSVASGGSFHNMDAPTPIQPPTAPLRQNSLLRPRSGQNENDNNGYGYTFYDIPENVPSKSAGSGRMKNPLSPIKQEVEDDLMDLEGVLDSNLNDMSIPAAITNGVNFDINFLKDMDDLTKDYDVNSRFMSNGYSFYGDSQLASSSNKDSNSPNSVLNSKQQDPGSASPMANGLRRDKLFTKGMRLMINKSLSKYPINGIMSPSIPSNDKLEFYLSVFVDLFLAHFPFIHPSKLNEYEIMSMTSNETQSNESARVCMPLLVATIGALYANNKNDAEHLYEALRRSIHIYLEGRKNTVGEANGSRNPFSSVNPLWLIQSLTLSVVYGLFSENENNVYIVIRQLNALNSLVKTSVKSNRTILFTINGDDEDHYKMMNDPESASRRGSLFSTEPDLNNDIMFKNSINMQSQVRIVFMIYKLTSFIFMLYNVPLTLSINDLGSLACPSVSDEYLWRFRSYSDFKGYQEAVQNPNTIEHYLDKAKQSNLVFKELLFRLSRNEFNSTLVNQLSELSRYGFTSLVHGIYEMNQYDEMKFVDVASILDNITIFLDASRNSPETRLVLNAATDYEKLDYSLLVNFSKISSWLDFRLVKEQSWLRNHEKLTSNFHQIVLSVEKMDDYDFLRVVDCCISSVKLILFRVEDVGLDFHGDLDHNVLEHANNTCSTFDKTIGWRVLDDIDINKSLIHSQLLFHIFTTLLMFAIFVAKRNHLPREYLLPDKVHTTEQLNERFVVVLEIMARIELFLKTKYQNSRHESDLANLFLFSSFGHDGAFIDRNSNFMANEESLRNTVQNFPHYFTYSLERSLYILKIGELILRYLYDTNIKLYVFRKLSASVLLMRKFLIDNESSVLQ